MDGSEFFKTRIHVSYHGLVLSSLVLCLVLFSLSLSLYSPWGTFLGHLSIRISIMFFPFPYYPKLFYFLSIRLLKCPCVFPAELLVEFSFVFFKSFLVSFEIISPLSFDLFFSSWIIRFVCSCMFWYFLSIVPLCIFFLQYLCLLTQFLYHFFLSHFPSRFCIYVGVSYYCTNKLVQFWAFTQLLSPSVVDGSEFFKTRIHVSYHGLVLSSLVLCLVLFSLSPSLYSPWGTFF